MLFLFLVQLAVVVPILVIITYAVFHFTSSKEV